MPLGNGSLRISTVTNTFVMLLPQDALVSLETVDSTEDLLTCAYNVHSCEPVNELRLQATPELQSDSFSQRSGGCDRANDGSQLECYFDATYGYYEDGGFASSAGSTYSMKWIWSATPLRSG